MRELSALTQRHQDEIGVAKQAQAYDPNWSRLFEYERMGILHCWTARADGVLIGYIGCICVPGLFYSSTLTCYAEPFYLAPEWRDGSRGWRFLKSVQQPLREMGVKVLRMTTNDTFQPDEDGRSRVSKLLVRDGFQRIETAHLKVL